MDKCELCGRTWGLLGITINADTGKVAVACGPCHEEESRKLYEKRKARDRGEKAA